MTNVSDTESWQGLVGSEVVLDTSTPFIFLGKLVAVDDWGVVLEDADVHDRNDGTSTKERYILEARKEGIRPNRKRVMVLKSMILSVSRLEDVIVY